MSDCKHGGRDVYAPPEPIPWRLVREDGKWTLEVNAPDMLDGGIDMVDAVVIGGERFVRELGEVLP